MVIVIVLGLTLLLGTANAEPFDNLPELKYLDRSVDPCDNFYQFTCGHFPDYHPLDGTSKNIDHFSILEDELIEIGQNILSLPPSLDDPVAVKKAKTAYQACINNSTDERYHTHYDIPEFQIIEEFGGFPMISNNNNAGEFTWNDIGDMVGNYGVPLIFSYTVGKLNQDEVIVMMQGDPLANPSMIRPVFRKTYDEILEESFKEFAAPMQRRSPKQLAPFDIFLQTIVNNLNQAQHDGTSRTEENILSDLNNMATFMRSLFQGGIIDENYIVLEDFPPTIGQLQRWTNEQFGDEIDINWLEYLSRLFRNSGIEITEDFPLYVVDGKLIYGILNLVRQTDPKIVKNFALLRLILFMAPDSYGPTREAFEEYYRAKAYAFYPRHEYCTRKILDAVDSAGLNFAVAYEFQRRHFNINKIPKAIEMIQRIRQTFTDTLHNVNWMDAASKEQALRKVDNLLVLLPYPDFVNDANKLDQFYENVRICEWDNYGNSKRIRAFKQAYLSTQLADPTDRTFWDKSAFDANAYYNRANNKIFFPIAMLNGVFFSSNNTLLDYSRIGSIIGHEITHGFDDSGKNYNADGMQIPWWSNYTVAQFKARTACFIDQYNKYKIEEIDTNVDGTKTLNENLADSAGIRQSYKAFKNLNRQSAISKEWTIDQAFFIAYATMWCSNESDAYLTLLSTSAYAPNQFRVNGAVSNMKEFAEAFNCPLDAKMNPKEKCVLW